jgi:hypothetical protein
VHSNCCYPPCWVAKARAKVEYGAFLLHCKLCHNVPDETLVLEEVDVGKLIIVE